MKILHIIDHSGIGGAQTLVKGIFENKKNKNLYLVILRKHKKTNFNIHHPNVNLIESSNPFSLKSVKIIRKIIKREKIGIIHCHLAKAEMIGVIMKKFYFPNIKLIFHEHGRIFRKSIWYNQFIKRSESSVDLFVCVSQATKNKLLEQTKIPKRKVIVLPNFIDNKRIKLTEKSHLNNRHKKEEFIIGFAGRLSTVKGCGYLIKALSKLKFSYKCLIAGEGDLKKKLQKEVKWLNLESNVIFLGFVKNISAFYSNLDILVVPSRSESFGLSALEAQSFGIPVIASDVDGLTEIIKDRINGLLFKKEDPTDLALKITLLKENPELYRKISKNSLKNIKKYNVVNYNRKLKLIYETARSIH